MEAGGGTIACSNAELLGAARLSSSGSTKARMVNFHFVSLSATAHLGSLVCTVPAVPDGPAVSEVVDRGAVGTDGV